MVNTKIHFPGMRTMSIVVESDIETRSKASCRSANAAGPSADPQKTRQKRTRNEQTESGTASKRRKQNVVSSDALTLDTSAVAGPSSIPDPFSATSPPTPNGLQLSSGEMPESFPAHFGRNIMYQSWVPSHHPAVGYEQPSVMPIGGYGSSYSPSAYSSSMPNTPAGSSYAASPGVFTPLLTPDVGTPYRGHGQFASSPYSPSNYGVIPLPQVPATALPLPRAPPQQSLPQPTWFIPPQPVPVERSMTYTLTVTQYPGRMEYQGLEYLCIPASSVLGPVRQDASELAMSESYTDIPPALGPEDVEISIAAPSPFPNNGAWEADSNLVVQTGAPLMEQEYLNVVQLKSRSRSSSNLHELFSSQVANVRVAQVPHSAPMPTRPLPVLDMDPITSFNSDPGLDALPTAAAVDVQFAVNSAAPQTTSVATQYMMYPDGNFGPYFRMPESQPAAPNPPRLEQDAAQYLPGPHAMYSAFSPSPTSPAFPPEWELAKMPEPLLTFSSSPMTGPDIG